MIDTDALIRAEFAAARKAVKEQEQAQPEESKARPETQVGAGFAIRK